jgi:hypothetical protein
MQTNARRTSTRPGYIFDDHKILVQELYSILDRAAVEYDRSEDVVDDFTAYLKDWAQEREQPER